MQVMCKCKLVALGGEGVDVAPELRLQYHLVARGIILQWRLDRIRESVKSSA